MVDVLIVGSGLSGLTAASLLQDQGHRVQVIDKGRNPGGRLASRQVDQHVFNHGCGSLDLDLEPINWLANRSGLALDSGPYLAGRAINEIASNLTNDLPVTQSVQAESLSYQGKQWLIQCHDFADNQQVEYQAKVLLLTLPAPPGHSTSQGGHRPGLLL